MCQVVPVPSGRKFGPFVEKTLVCDPAARQAIDHLCAQGGFTQAWAETGSNEKFTMTKIPAIIPIKLMLELGSEHEDIVVSIRGAYSISMEPDSKSSIGRTISQCCESREDV